MALAETAKLLASLELKDNFTPGVKKAEDSLGRLEQKFGRIGGIASKGFKTIGSNLKSMLTGPAGIIAGGAAVFALTGFISGSVDKAREFGDTVFKLRSVIGGSTEQVSRLVDILGDYGIASDTIIRLGGITEKNLAALTKTQKTAAKFQKDYGIGLLDNTGKAKDFNAILHDAADLYTNKSIPQTQKIAALTKIFGRSWAELIPILALGGAGVDKALGKAITLTDEQAKSLEKARKAGIKWEDAIGDLQTTIGIELLPVITKFVSKLTRFVETHGDEIRAFFRDAAKFALGMGQAIKNDVLPAIGKIGDVWAGIPDDLKKVLIGGFVVNKLSGGAITGIFSELAKGLIKGVLGINAGVVNINAATVTGAGGVPGVPAAAAGAGAIGVGGALLGAGTAAGLIAGPIVTQLTVNDANAELHAAGIKDELVAVTSPWDFPALLHNISILPGAFGQVLNPVKTATQQSGARILSAIHGDTNSTKRNLDQVTTAVHSGSQSTARNLDQVTAAVRAKKLSVTVRLSQRQRQAIAANLSTGARQGKAGFHYTKSQEHALDIDRVLAAGAVGMTNGPMTALIGEAGREMYAILKNPHKGTIGGGGGVPIVHVHVNIDPRRITRKQTSSGVYKTYVAT